MKPPYQRETYPGGLQYLQAQHASRRFQFKGLDDFLPPLDCDFDPFKTALVTFDPNEAVPPAQTIARKYHTVSQEFDGLSEFLLLHALLIAVSRHDDPPAQAIALFIRIWREEQAYLSDNLSTRWKVSALKTFADYGETEQDRRAAATLHVMISTMQIYESERLWGGFRPVALFNFANRIKQKVVLDLQPYPMRTGDAERNMLMGIWEDCEGTSASLKPLALELLTLINRDRRSVFRRIQRHKKDSGAESSL